MSTGGAKIGAAKSGGMMSYDVMTAPTSTACSTTGDYINDRSLYGVVRCPAGWLMHKIQFSPGDRSKAACGLWIGRCFAHVLLLTMAIETLEQCDA